MKRRLLIISASLVALLAVAAGYWFLVVRPGQQPQTQPSIDTSPKTNVTVGKASAPVEIVIYLDLLCPDCRRAHEQVIPRITKDYVTTGKARLKYKMLGTYGPESVAASNGAYCAHEQGKFFAFVEAGYQAQAHASGGGSGSTSDVSPFTNLGLTKIARASGVSLPAWQACTEAASYTDSILNHKKEVLATGGYGTPHFIINGKGYNGAPPYDVFVPVINAALEAAKTQPERK